MPLPLPTPSAAWTAHAPNRAKWSPHGAWTDEPDAALWMTAAGLPGAILRHAVFGHLSGYVAVPRGHRVFSMTLDDIDNYNDEHRPPQRIGLGELTFARGGADPLAASAANMDAEWWWIGFDAMHVADEVPLFAPGNPDGNDPLWGPDGVYRTWSYVEREVEGLAKQIAAV